MLLTLGLILVVLKLLGLIAWSWPWVMLPWAGSLVLWVMYFVMWVAFGPFGGRR